MNETCDNLLYNQHEMIENLSRQKGRMRIVDKKIK